MSDFKNFDDSEYEILNNDEFLNKYNSETIENEYNSENIELETIKPETIDNKKINLLLLKAKIRESKKFEFDNILLTFNDPDYVKIEEIKDLDQNELYIMKNLEDLKQEIETTGKFKFYNVEITIKNLEKLGYSEYDRVGKIMETAESGKVAKIDKIKSYDFIQKEIDVKLDISIEEQSKIPCGYILGENGELIEDFSKGAPSIGCRGNTGQGFVNQIFVTKSIKQLHRNKEYKFLYWCCENKDNTVAKIFKDEIYRLSDLEYSDYFGLNYKIYNYADDNNLQ